MARGAHRGALRVQVRANEIGNQIARGLEWASKTFFRSKDQRFTQNILTDLMSGDIIKSAGRADDDPLRSPVPYAPFGGNADRRQHGDGDRWRGGFTRKCGAGNAWATRVNY